MIKARRKHNSFVANFFLVATTFFIYTTSTDSQPSANDAISGNCVLNFSSYPYQPSGECIGTQEKIKQWDSLRTTLCCRDALAAFSQALAVHLSSSLNATAIFLPSDLWSACTGHFLRQPSVSPESCGFSRVFSPSAPTHCSNISLQGVAGSTMFKPASDACSSTLFDNSPEDACSGCAASVMSLRDDLLENSRRDKDKKSEKALCAMAAVVSVAYGMVQNPSQTRDFFQCLRVLDEIDPDYIKIKNSLAHILLAIIVAITTLLLITVLVKHVTKKKTRKPPKSKEYTNAWSGLYRFSKEEIDNAINYWNERQCLGRGSAGHVYKGTLPSGQEVAIKHINRNNNQTDSFKREAEGLSRIRHPNLVSLFGYCMEEDGNYLVYEYCSGGNLAQQLLRKDTLLNWDKRVKILRYCALALRHLHNFIDGYIVHRDVKLTNILLTDDLEPKLSDFGLARIMNMEESKVFTDVRGTIGYMDPEYMSNAKLTRASDVYSFGIVILQILSGLRVIDLNVDARDQLTTKARNVSMGNRPLEDFEDPRLGGNINKADFKSILQIAVLCVAQSGEDRPSIDIVYNEMDKAWRNTDEFKQMKKSNQEPTSSATHSTSMEMILPV